MRRQLRAWAELAGMWAIAIAHPMFQNMTAGPEALSYLGIGRMDILIVVGIVLLGVPTLLWLVEACIGRFGHRYQPRAHAALLGAMIALLAWQATGRPETILAGALVVGTVWLASTWGYLRISFIRSLGGALSIATPVVLIAFVASSPVRFEVQPSDDEVDVDPIESDTPVVVMAFDEWPLASITSSTSRIDGRLFPGMAALARESTWFPNALAGARMTIDALPAIVTGRRTRSEGDEIPPSEAGHPVNLCTIFRAGGYRVSAQEQYSNFCGGKFSRRVRLTSLLRRGVTPDVLPGEGGSALIDSLAGDVPDPSLWYGRGIRLQRFVDEVRARPRSLSFIHSLLPHHPWYLTRAGQKYELPDESDATVAGGKSQWLDEPARIDYVYQRMMLQIGFVDRMIGDLVKRMKSEGVWEEAMVVVTADHGANLSAGHTRRGLDEDVFADIASVPMFVKHPYQASGRVDRRFARVVDLLPTVLDELGVEHGIEMDGVSLGRPGERADRSALEEQAELTLADGSDSVSIPVPEFRRQRARLLERRNRLFGEGSLFALGGSAHLVGGPVPTADAEELRFELLEGEEGPIADLYGAPTRNAAVFDAELATAPGEPRAVAVVYGRKVLATARTYVDAGDRHRVTVVLPPSPEPRSTEVPLRLFSIG